MEADQFKWLAALADELKRRVQLEIADVGDDTDILTHYPDPVNEVVDYLIKKYDLAEVD
jgi:hypothetical protein